MSNQPTLLFGFPEAQYDFEKKYKPLAMGLSNIKIACDIAISNTSTTTLEEKVLNFLAWQAFEDFSEIFLLCANGCNNGARKILRGMYERVVYFLYLEKHREQIELYMNYFWIDRYKTAKRLPEIVKDEDKKELDEMYEKYKSDYEVPVCDVCRAEDCTKCKKKRVNYSWTRVDIVTMAKQVGISDKLTEMAYYISMEETHPKVGAILRRLKFDEDSNLFHDMYPKDGEEKQPLIAAHFFLMKILDMLKTCFKIEALEEPLKICLKDFKDTWKKQSAEI